MQRKLDSLQALRALAALSVVASHILRKLIITGHETRLDRYVANIGGIGVDIFFLLSGFLMMYISRPYFLKKKSAGQFLAQRLIRIWPPYIIATSICYLMILRSYFANGWISFDLRPYRLWSFLFVPTLNERGLLQPVIGVGWTLSYEMIFYAVFAVVIVWRGRQALLKLTGLLLIIYIFGWIFRETYAGAFLATTMLFEFLAGAFLGHLIGSETFAPRRPALWIVSSATTYVIFALIDPGQIRIISLGIPGLLLFIGFLATGTGFRWPKFITLLGDASYSIYLIHTLIIYWVIAKSVKTLDAIGFMRGTSLVTAIVSFVSALLAGLLFHLLLEKPALRTSQKIYNRYASRKIAAPIIAQ